MRTSEHLSALTTGARLNIYSVERVLGAGGFGITYRAREDITERVVAIKEYLPSSLAVRGRDGASVRPISESARTDYEWGLARFRDEAKLLIGLKHPNIVPVLSYFEANGTGYLVMEFQAGRSLGEMLAKGATLEENTMRSVLLPLLDGVEAVHRAGFLHRDIKPDNVFVREDGAPVLLDFGAARQALGQHSRSLTAVLTEGYAPYEQYHRDGNQGPWTDIYALGAVMFRCLLGNKPAEAPKRVDARFRDGPDPLAEDFARLRAAAPETCRAIEAALGLRESDRPQSVAALRALLLRPSPEASAAASAPAALASATLIQQPPASGVAAPPRAARRGRVVAFAAAGAVLFAGAAFATYMVAGGDRSDPAQLAAAREAEEAKRRVEAQRKADEERARLEAERRRQEEQRAKLEAEAKRKAEEEARRRAEEEARRKAEEEKQRAERARLEAEQRKRAEEDARRKAEEQRKTDEERGKAEEQRKAEEARRKADEAGKSEAERADAEAKRKADAEAKQKAERIAAATARTRDRLASGRAALGAKRLLEAKRLAADAGAALRELAQLEAAHPDLAALRRQHDALDADVKHDIAARVGELVRTAREAIKANRAADAKQRLDEAAMLDPGSTDLAAARRDLAAMRRDEQPSAPGSRYPRAQLTQMVYQRIMASPNHSVTMYKGAGHQRALYACVDWNASTPQNVVTRGFGYGYETRSSSRARDLAMQYCRSYQSSGCECTLVDETTGPALTLPGTFAAKYAN